MSLSDILYSLIIKPIQILFEYSYMVIYKAINNPGLTIIALSLIINILILPLYIKADQIQEEVKKKENSLSKGVKHIKKYFKSDERMMILQTYYRQNNYSPTDTLKSAISLLLQIPFFIAAYNFLSSLNLLNGASFGIINDLSKPDALITILDYKINLLPILMTIINIISCYSFSANSSFKSNIQLYLLSIIFLLILYNSPSGLVLYWTFNNIFALVKNLYLKNELVKHIIKYLASALGIMLLIYQFIIIKQSDPRKSIVIFLLFLLLQMPLVLSINHKMLSFNVNAFLKTRNNLLYILLSIFLSLFIGAYIPSNVISSSPQEFVYITMFFNPLWYVVSSLLISLGVFVLWSSVFYYLSSSDFKCIITVAYLIIMVLSIINYFFFGTKLGILTQNLKFLNGMFYDKKEIIINILVNLFFLMLIIFIIIKFDLYKIIKNIVTIAIITVAIITSINSFNIYKSVRTINIEDENNLPKFNLSKHGKNVVIIMLDAAMGEYVPYIFNEVSELKELYAGFTYYANTLSYGAGTIFGAPPLFGGYEYTPYEMNKRDDVKMIDKHNESLKVIPKLFSDNGFDVTICDAPYANYQEIPDMTIFDDIKNVKTYITRNRFVNKDFVNVNINYNLRNFFCFSSMKCMPLFMQPLFYDWGAYLSLNVDQTIINNHSAVGLDQNFISAYNVLTNFINMTSIKQDESNNCFIITNDITHEPIMLKEPEFEPSERFDNTDYDLSIIDKRTIDGLELKMENPYQIKHYQSNVAAFLRIADWLDFLRKNNLYDNTRIILVSDHGRSTFQYEKLVIDEPIRRDFSVYYPLLMVKDFNSNELSISNEFMTHADTPYLAAKDIVDELVNPYTKNIIDNTYKNTNNNYVIEIGSGASNKPLTFKNTFPLSNWYFVKDDVRESKNWEICNSNSLMP